ncbi:hypothetical protein WCN91_08140 [Pseudoalteromonas sp. YIC-827]|uniref:Uncharacterized protein n=1 Tax=Pseudoalteromonas qingdaonensis TaxID=3131913 RepID=A0ABU9N147_9GAMM
MYNLKWAFFIVLSAFTMPLSASECEQVSMQLSHEYNTFSQYRFEQSPLARYQLKVRLEAPEQCVYRLQISSQNQYVLLHSGAQLRYRLLNEQFNAWQQSSPLTGGKELTLIGELDGHQIARAGIYRDLLTFELMLGDSLVSSQSYELEGEIEQHLQLAWLGAQATHAFVDLGELKSGQYYGHLPQLFIQANVPVALEISSLNQGKLVHQTTEKWRVGYMMELLGQWANLESPWRGNTPLVQNQTLLPLAIELEQFDQLAAGNYQDTVTIRLVPQQF